MDNFTQLKSSIQAIQNIINIDISPAFDDLSNNSEIFNDLIDSYNEIKTILNSIDYAIEDIEIVANGGNLPTPSNAVIVSPNNPDPLSFVDDVGALHLNINSGVLYVCIFNNGSETKWYGQANNNLIKIFRLSDFDVFSDASCVAFFKFDNNFLYDGNFLITQNNVPSFGASLSTTGNSAKFLNSTIKTNFNFPSVFSLSFSFKASSVASACLMTFNNGAFGFDLVLYNNRLGFATAKGVSHFATVSPNVLYKILIDSNLNLWVNGVKSRVTTSFAWNNPSVATPFQIGYSGAYGGYFYDGLLDNLRVFNKILSDNERLLLLGDF